MLKKRELTDCHDLFDLLVHPEVFPYVREKATSYEEYLFMTKKTIQAEVEGKLVSRTILDEWGDFIGTITLFDIQDGAGFLGTWIGQPYFGKGYNSLAKEQFLEELFYEIGMESVFMKIRRYNERSNKAAEKLPYVSLANESHISLYNEINKKDDVYNLYSISKDLYSLYKRRFGLELENQDEHLKEA